MSHSPRWLIRYRNTSIVVNRPPRLRMHDGRVMTSGDWVYLVGGGHVSIHGQIVGDDIEASVGPAVLWLRDGQYELLERFPRWLRRV